MNTHYWPTQKHDIELAHQILLSYRTDHNTTELKLENVSMVEDGQIITECADWVIDLAEAFEKKYGHKLGWEVTTKVITALMIDEETRH